MTKPLNILLLGKGAFEGRYVGDAIIRRNNRDPVGITNIPLLLDGQNQSNVVRDVENKIKDASFHAVVVVLSLPVRATPETEKLLSTIKQIVGHQLKTNTILLLTNGQDMNRNPRQFQEFLSSEIESSKKDAFSYVSLGTLIKEVSINRCMLFDLNTENDQERNHQNENVINLAKQLPEFRHTGSQNIQLDSQYLKWLVLAALAVLIAVAYHSFRNLESELHDRNRTVNSFNNTITSLKGTIVNLSTNLDTTSLQVSNLTAQIADKDNKIQYLVSTNNSNQMTIATLETENKIQNETIQGMNNDKVNLSNTLKDKINTIEKLTSELASKDDTIVSQDKEIKVLKEQAAERDSTIKQQKDDLDRNKENIQRINELKVEMNNGNKTILEQKLEIAASRKATDKLQAEVKNKDDTMKKEQAKLEEYKQQIEQLNLRLDNKEKEAIELKEKYNGKVKEKINEVQDKLMEVELLKQHIRHNLEPSRISGYCVDCTLCYNDVLTHIDCSENQRKKQYIETTSGSWLSSWLPF